MMLRLGSAVCWYKHYSSALIVADDSVRRYLRGDGCCCSVQRRLMSRDDYKDFAEVCFKEFVDRIKHWATFNEPYTLSAWGYDTGIAAPGCCSSWMNNDCPAGNSATEPYIVAQFVLLCHAQTVKLYREKYKPFQKGQIGMVRISHWFVPYSKKQADAKAAQRALDFMYGCDDYKDFAEVCFKEFGDRIKHWATFNEPYTLSAWGYDTGIAASGRCSSWMNNDCPAGNSATEPYIVAQFVLLCHAQTVKLYREKYKPFQKGQIGMVLISHWFVPYSKKQADAKAAQRALDFMYGW
ncbi:beta-glucosidase 12-like [Olea europaea subsp. europaea]|uniref:Beta-glucosidase 12-like n=1 Tax=Olea europaea subsp. europaea TaxID=158383 RepID=A0A8S0TAK5_OLEEU|nr:beta-glucosidase 12-like [Olea europaea subsp. europaea]